jgi:hypothetical protein
MAHLIDQSRILLFLRLAPCSKQPDCINELLPPLPIFQLLKDENFLLLSVHVHFASEVRD